jgi:hypothetical protein
MPLLQEDYFLVVSRDECRIAALFFTPVVLHVSCECPYSPRSNLCASKFITTTAAAAAAATEAHYSTPLHALKSIPQETIFRKYVLTSVFLDCCLLRGFSGKFMHQLSLSSSYMPSPF